MILIINKSSHKFMESTKSDQKSGLSVCLSMIRDKFSEQIELFETGNFVEIIDEIQKKKPKACIFQANQYQVAALNQLKDMFTETKFFVQIHSKFPFLGQEKGYIGFINGLNKCGIGVIFNHQDAYECFNNPLNVCLRNVYFKEYEISGERQKDNELHVGCHGSMRLLKNTIFQAFVAIRLAEDLNKTLVFHINSSRDDGDMQTILLALYQIFDGKKHRIEHTPWLSHDDFIKYSSQKLDLGLQLSLSETFNTVAADYVTAGVPVVVSEEIDWLSFTSKTSATSFSAALSKCKVALMCRNELMANNKNALRAHNSLAVDQWTNFLNNYN